MPYGECNDKIFNKIFHSYTLYNVTTEDCRKA